MMDADALPVKRFCLKLGLIFILAFIFYVGVILALGHFRNPNYWENGEMAKSILAGRGLCITFSQPDAPTSWQAPGYPYVLAGFWRVFGVTPTAYFLLSVVQAAVMASVVFPLYWLSRHWFGNEVAWISAWSVLLMPLYAWYATRIHHTAFVMAFQPWLLAGWLSISRQRWSLVILTGVMTGIAGLFQPVMLGIFGGISLVLMLNLTFQKDWAGWSRIMLAGILTLLTLVPWTIRNYQIHGRLVLVKDSFGKEFWMGNNPHTTGTGYAEGGAEEITNVYPPKAFGLMGKEPEIVVMNAMGKEAWDYCKAEPGAFVNRTLTKIVWFWTKAPSRFLRSTKGGEALRFAWLQMAYWMIMMTSMVVAAVLFRPWSKEYLWIMLFYVIFYSLIYGLTHVGQVRFRGEIEFIFLPAVAAGITGIWKRFCHRTSDPMQTNPVS